MPAAPAEFSYLIKSLPYLPVRLAVAIQNRNLSRPYEFENPKGFGTMSRANGEKQVSLPAEIRRQIKTAANARYFRALHEFRAETDLPPEFRRLLGELEEVERKGGGSPRAS
jgi:hypothetical protein